MITTKKTKIFISHKRTEGQATSEAILIKDGLDKKGAFDTFMDVREDYIGDFPTVLKNKIKDCDVFLLIFANDNIDYLLDKNNWVHKEIHYALNYKDLNNKPTKIIPIAFKDKFSFPPKQELDDIANISNYNIFYYNTNDPNIQQRLYKAIGTNHYINIKKLSLLFLFLCIIIALFLILKPKQESHLDIISYPQIEKYVEKMNTLNSLQEFTTNASKIQQEYLAWYLEELNNGNKDISLNNRFNEFYIKEWCIRLTILSYLAYTSGDLSTNQDANLIQKLIIECYNQIPENLRYPIGFRKTGIEEGRSILSECLDKVFAYLNTHPQLKKIDESQIPLLKAAIIKQSFP